MSVVRELTNYQLLRLRYSDKRDIKRILKSWGALESLSYKGDTVAMCILADMKKATGIELDNYDRFSLRRFGGDRDRFNNGYKSGKLSEYQFMAIAYCLVLGYSQEEVAYVMGVDQSVISRNINSGIKKIQKVLRAFEEGE